MPESNATGRSTPVSPIGTPPTSGETGRVLTPDLLNQAAGILEERGLAKLAYFDPDGSCCILGAVALARGYKPEETGLGMAEYLFIDEPMGELAVLMGCDPVAFSDDPQVATMDAVVALLQAAETVHSRGDARATSGDAGAHDATQGEVGHT